MCYIAKQMTYLVYDKVKFKVQECLQFKCVLLSLAEVRCVFPRLQPSALLLRQVFALREQLFDSTDAQTRRLQLMSASRLTFQQLLVAFIEF